MKLFRSVCALALSALLLCSGMAQAAPAWTDLPGDHWAYAAMSGAAERGILTGFPDGSMAPAGELTWGQYLAMLDRAFFPGFYANALAAGLSWDQGGYWAARDNGLLYDGDFLPVLPGTLWDPICRQDAAVLLYRAILSVDPGRLPGESPAGAETFPDWDSLSPTYQTAVGELAGLGIIQGRLDGSFDGGTVIQRADGAVLLMRVIALLEAPAEPDPPEEEPPLPWGGDPLLCQQGENAAKYQLLFGDPAKRRFTGETEANAHMAEVEVPVWSLSGGERVPSTVTLTVHAALAEDVTAIFTEIFRDPEQFPILDAGGYDWRGDQATGEHNCGTAIDLNWRQNYQVRSGRAQAGDHWLPGEDPWSIPPDGSVVRIFKAHGWSWGGDAWADSWDAESGYHDYMHFSYMGM